MYTAKRKSKGFAAAAATFVANFCPRITFGDVQRHFASAALDISISTPSPSFSLSPPSLQCISRSVLRKLELKAVNESNKFHGFGNVETAIRVRESGEIKDVS